MRRTTLSYYPLKGEAAGGCFSQSTYDYHYHRATTVTRPQRYPGTVYVVQHA